AGRLPNSGDAQAERTVACFSGGWSPGARGGEIGYNQGASGGWRDCQGPKWNYTSYTGYTKVANIGARPHTTQGGPLLYPSFFPLPRAVYYFFDVTEVTGVTRLSRPMVSRLPQGFLG